jgi:hypothetical protein
MLQAHPAPFNKLRVRKIVCGIFRSKMAAKIYHVLSLLKGAGSSCNDPDNV